MLNGLFLKALKSNTLLGFFHACGRRRATDVASETKAI
jgi:hypothetical protein